MIRIRLQVTVRCAVLSWRISQCGDITATADFQSCPLPTRVPVRLSVNKYIDKQIEDISGSVDSMKLEVEDKKEKQL